MIDVSRMQLLGAGQYGRVYRLDDKTALKIITKPPKVSMSSWKRAVEKEHAIQTALHHLGIAPGVGKLSFETNQATMPMDIIRGSIRSFFNDMCNMPGSRPCQAIPNPIQKAAIGVLEKAIEHGFIHSDNHLDNIGVNLDGMVTLIDFGFTQQCDKVPDCWKLQALEAALYQIIEYMTFNAFVETEFYNVIYLIRQGKYKFGSHMHMIGKKVFTEPAQRVTTPVVSDGRRTRRKSKSRVKKSTSRVKKSTTRSSNY